ETGDVVPRIRALVVEVGVDVLLGGECVDDIGLRAVAGAERADLRAGFVLVVEAFVRSLSVKVYGSAAGGSWRRGLIGKIKRAASEIADHAGVAGHGEVAAEAKRKGTDVAREVGVRGIERDDDVGNLPGSNARSRDLDHVFAGRSVEEIVAEA